MHTTLARRGTRGDLHPSVTAALGCPNVLHPALRTHWLILQWVACSLCRTQQGEEGEEQPEFLPMFPWYSGTSADMYRTVFELLVSVKLFLGRFDMRTMQVSLFGPGLAACDLSS